MGIIGTRLCAVDPDVKFRGLHCATKFRLPLILLKEVVGNISLIALSPESESNG